MTNIIETKFGTLVNPSKIAAGTWGYQERGTILSERGTKNA